MNPSNNGDGFSQAPEDYKDEAINSRDPPDIMPKYNIFNEYGHNAKINSYKTFNPNRTYERPYVNYYIVVTPYGNRKGMTMHDIKNIVRRRWYPERYIVTYENKNEEGKRVNPHYNIIITTRNKLKTSNSNNLNIDVQTCENNKQINRSIEYSFKTYMMNLKCLKDKHFYAWIR